MSICGHTSLSHEEGLKDEHHPDVGHCAEGLKSPIQAPFKGQVVPVRVKRGQRNLIG